MSICYDVNGVQDNAIPCYDSSTLRACCTPGDLCLSTGLCEPGPGRPNTGDSLYYRPAGCTDTEWNTGLCFNGCNSVVGNGLQACGNETYCCYNFNGCVCSSTSLFQLGIATIVTSLAGSATSTPASAVATVTTTLTSLTSRTSTVPIGTSTQNGSGNGSNGTALGAGLGAGLGVPLLLGVLASVYFFCFRKPKKQLQHQETSPYYAWKSELDGRHERQLPAELHPLPRRVELDGKEQKQRDRLGDPAAELSS